MNERQCKLTLSGIPITLREFNTEEDRLEAIKLFYGIEFSESERKGVLGTAVSLGGHMDFT